jgi:hypothetical protein
MFVLIMKKKYPVKFSEVRGYKRAPIWAPRLPLAPHTIPARPD